MIGDVGTIGDGKAHWRVIGHWSNHGALFVQLERIDQPWVRTSCQTHRFRPLEDA